MKLTVHVTDDRDWTLRWLTLFQGMVQYSEREKDVLVELITTYLELRAKVLDEELLWKTLLGTECRKQMMQRLGLTRFAFGNYLKTFRQHGLLTSNESYESLLPSLIPQQEFKVSFRGPTI